MKRVEKIIKNISVAYDVECDLFIDGIPGVVNDNNFCEEMKEYIKYVLGEDKVHITGQPSSGSEDFAFITQEVPTMLIWLGAGSDDGFPLHSPHAVFNENAICTGALVMAYFAIRWLDNNKQMEG